MINREHDLAITKQAKVLRVSRGSVYYLPRAVPEADLAIMRRLDRLHLEFPFAGSRMLRGLLAAEGCKIGRRHVKATLALKASVWFQRGRLFTVSPVRDDHRRCRAETATYRPVQICESGSMNDLRDIATPLMKFRCRRAQLIKEAR